jgi:hypothetical protein
VARADFLELPVHAGGAVVVNLDAIHADVALAGVGILVTTQGSVMKRPPSRASIFGWVNSAEWEIENWELKN